MSRFTHHAPTPFIISYGSHSDIFKPGGGIAEHRHHLHG
jgi:hypothetical protein